MTVPFLDLQASYLELKEEIDAAVARVLASGWYILGEEVSDFEKAFARVPIGPHLAKDDQELVIQALNTNLKV